MSKRRRDGGWSFECDGCGRMASYSRDEKEARESARRLAKQAGWQWKHPRWQLYCPDCQ